MRIAALMRPAGRWYTVRSCSVRKYHSSLPREGMTDHAQEALHRAHRAPAGMGNGSAVNRRQRLRRIAMGHGAGSTQRYPVLIHGCCDALSADLIHRVAELHAHRMRVLCEPLVHEHLRAGGRRNGGNIPTRDNVHAAMLQTVQLSYALHVDRFIHSFSGAQACADACSAHGCVLYY